MTCNVASQYPANLIIVLAHSQGCCQLEGESSIWFRCADCQFTQYCYVHAGQCNQDNTAHRDFVWNKLLKQAGIRPDSKADE